MTNIAELLKDCPKGTKLYSPLLGEVEFAEVMNTDYMSIRVIKRGYGVRFDKYGRYMGSEYPDAECLLFPNKDCRTWEGWETPVEPKFKVGDDIKTGSTIETIAEIDYATRSYCCESGRTIWFENQDLWCLAPKKHYDIANFKPFDKVLGRNCCRSGVWRADYFSHIHKNGKLFVGIGYTWEQCIPFNDDTKHLLGTTDKPSEKYINW